MRRRERFYRWFPEHPTLVDLGYAVLLSLLVLSWAPALAYGEGFSAVIATVTGLAMAATVVFRRSAPVASFTVLVLLHVVQWALGITLGVQNGIALIGLYSVAAYGPRRVSRLGLGIGILGAAMAAQRYFFGTMTEVVANFAGMVLLVVAAWAMGDVRNVRVAFERQLVERAELAERDRDQRARIATVEERARIAREMHDIVAHNVSVMIVQADGGRYAAAADPAAAVTALDTIATTGRQALTEMRRLLGVLREDPADPTAANAAMLPQPDLQSLPQLVEGTRSVGLPVHWSVSGDVRSVPDSVGLVAYRIVQEALTNTLKHAGAVRRVQVTLTYAPDRIELEIIDDGRGAAVADDGHGHGLLGMRERAAVHGGTVVSGPAPGGGWAVRARIPDRLGEATERSPGGPPAEHSAPGNGTV